MVIFVHVGCDDMRALNVRSTHSSMTADISIPIKYGKRMRKYTTVNIDCSNSNKNSTWLFDFIYFPIR